MFVIRFSLFISVLSPQPSAPHVFIAALGEKADLKTFELINVLRQNGIRVERDYEGSSLKSQLRKANKFGVKYTLIIGDNELDKGKAVLKDMSESKQEEVDISKIAEILIEKSSRQSLP